MQSDQTRPETDTTAETDSDRPTPDSEAVSAAQSNTASTPTPEPARRRRSRPWLLACLLAALIALLVYRPAWRADAAVWARTTAMDTFHISPRDIYAARLRIAGIEDSALGQRWRNAVARAGADPGRFTTRYATRGTFVPDTIEAHVYQTTLERGERFQVRLQRDAPACAGCRNALYADIERRDTDSDDSNAWAHVSGLPANGEIQSFVTDRDGDYRVVLQPELAAAVRYDVAMARGGSLSFPVKGAAARDIGSGFGAPRDGGSRRHHGVDIFAARGTPVTAVADGRVRTGTGGIGGNHVWLSSGMLGIGGARYYYAHLDSFNVESGASVSKGDVLGYVGNTGNARTTPPHLHFGIYTSFGPVDPAPFLRPPAQLAAVPSTVVDSPL
ncbi:metalloendopeptidase-like membrane protein [Salinisphaera shabanensis T35B1]|uniref:M23 family metallopeptidase n=1 Tax=Salinisphaera shabanensis TaxID=180542 RepID=UPI003342C75A